MSNWYWIICPKCGGMNDSGFMGEDFIDMKYKSPEEFKSINKGSIVCCSDCDKETVLDLCEVVQDENL